MAKYVSRAPKRPKKSKVIIFLNIVIGLLAALVIICLIGLVSSNRDSSYNRQFGDSYSSYSLERGEYSELINEYERDYGILGMVNSGYEDLAAVAEYAEAAFRYNAYQKAGDTERAAKQKARMDEAAGKTGIYEPELLKIDLILNR